MLPESPIVDEARECRAILDLMTIEGVGWATINALRLHFGTVAAGLGASPGDLAGLRGLTRRTFEALQRWEERADRARIDRVLESCPSQGISIHLLGGEGYPRPLADLFDPPAVVFVQGVWQEERDARSVAIVGTRWASPYGLDVTRRLGRNLAASGMTIVSGLARGIDRAAHEAALEIEGGRTVAVLGCGLGHVYPAEHRELARRIAGRGCLVSELLPDEPPRQRHFPRRNRLIAALSLGTIVVEAPERSGALITAREALELGREVFAVPGNVTSRNSVGCHGLIRDGARLVETHEDVLDELAPRLRFLEHPASSGPPTARPSAPSISPPGSAPPNTSDRPHHEPPE